MTQPELDWFYGGGAGRFWPELWESFASLVPPSEQGDFIAAYHKRLFSGDHQVETKFARAWARWENALASIESDGIVGEAPAEYSRAFARIENHYFHHGGFLSQDQQILRNMPKIADIPGVIVQGRFDMICPPVSAYQLAALWPKADLRIVARAGHALSETGISAELIAAMDLIGTRAGALHL